MPDEPDFNVVLTGFMGTGKTTVGRCLAERLDRPFVDTDALIVERYGPIPVIFAEHGETVFRRIEHEVAAELAARTRRVIATGGRMLLDPDNAAALAATGRVFCLVASVDSIVARVAPDGDAGGRPLLQGPDVRTRITQLLRDRAPAYAVFEPIETDGRTIDEVCDAIVAALAP